MTHHTSSRNVVWCLPLNYNGIWTVKSCHPHWPTVVCSSHLSMFLFSVPFTHTIYCTCYMCAYIMQTNLVCPIQKVQNEVRWKEGWGDKFSEHCHIWTQRPYTSVSINASTNPVFHMYSWYKHGMQGPLKVTLMHCKKMMVTLTHM